MKLPFWPNPTGYRDIVLGLARVYQLLERLGNPHLKLPPTIHLAGTNGKGSTLSFLRSIFEESGLNAARGCVAWMTPGINKQYRLKVVYNFVMNMSNLCTTS